MDEWQARAMAVALCGRRLSDRRTHSFVGTGAIAAAVLAIGVLVTAGPTAWSMPVWIAAFITGLGGFAILVLSRRFPSYSDAYGDLGLDPLTDDQLLEVEQILASQPDLRPVVASWVGYDVPLRQRDLRTLRQLRRTRLTVTDGTVTSRD